MKPTSVSALLPGLVGFFAATGLAAVLPQDARLLAQALEGPLRLKPPVRNNSTVGSINGQGIGPSCPQMYLSSGNGNKLLQLAGQFSNLPIFQTVEGASEDCLTINVQRPAGTSATSKLPVLYWIFGGGFELGTNAMYDVVSLLAQGVKIGEPFVFVAVNYRTGGFGFLGGKEIKADGASNRRRVGLEWVADNIAAFGGDPARVTIWGESAGSVSVFDQMALYDGDNTYKGQPLFRAGIMDSGSVQGKYADVPFIIGDQEDEGTFFAVLLDGLSTTDKIVAYLSKYYFSSASSAQLTAFVDTYSSFIWDGSPFNTGIFNELWPGFKRVAAILGDMTFTLARRALLQIGADVKPATPSWSYLASYNYGFPVLGTFHATDILQTFYGILPNYASAAIQTYYINFLYNADPNQGAPVSMQWPQWSKSKQIVQFYSLFGKAIDDDFRQDSYEYLYNNIDIVKI
ncbi:hypothetical protein SCUCBS95973_002930 [Sporothrix curviconia]|uniref:Carboxylic ester hydrolase n=1 Tax=Sporothrix curviconia TaxID=1260050 RepID=A0ABP0BB21_9PEZI